ncbi:MAG: hypothetical protein WBR13_11345 [Allosphingosinicella sp.]
MRLTAGALAGLILAAEAGEAQAEDWRALTNSHHDIVFVDADSVRREADGRIAFRTRHRLAENDSNRDFGYDRIDVAVAGRCERSADGQPVPAVGRRTYRLQGRPIPVQSWREEGLNGDLGGIAADMCDGRIGHRRFVDLDSAMAEYAEHDSLERLAAHVTGEVELVGTVVQGWEMNAVSLCGSEQGCSDGSPEEFCWLDGNIAVPAPAGAPEWVNGGPRRDSAGAAFRGRIHRSREGKGFGHMGGFACLVEATGPARFVTVPGRPEARSEAKAPASSEAIAAHQGFAESIETAARVGLVTGPRRWEIDEFSPGTGSLDACYSRPRFKGADLDFPAPLLGWRGVERIGRDGARLVLASREYDPDLIFYAANPEASRETEDFLRKLSARGVQAVSQKGAKVAVLYSDGEKESFRFGDPPSAVHAAGMAHRLRGREIAEVKAQANRVTATALRLISITFPDEALARRSQERMEALRAACTE